MPNYVIDDNVPLPARGTTRKYPFAGMKVGQSFAIGDDDRSRVRSAAAQHGARNGGKFIVRKTDTGSCRCWRIA